MIYYFTTQKHCVMFKNSCSQKRTNLHLHLFKDMWNVKYYAKV